MSQTNRLKEKKEKKAVDYTKALDGADPTRLYRAINAVIAEVELAGVNYPPMRSAHEGLSVIREEVLELEKEVFIKQADRDPARMKIEAVQVAAMAVRFLIDICNGNERL